jgi:cobalt-zinc-cadmium efflux system protein
MKGAYFEVVADLLTSVGVMVAGLIMWTTNWYLADPILSAGIGLFIFPRTWGLLKEAVGVLLEGTPSDLNLAALRETMAQVDGVGGVHDLHVWSLTSSVNAMSAHVVVRSGAQYDQVLEAVRTSVTTNFKISHVTLQMEPNGCEARETHL